MSSNGSTNPKASMYLEDMNEVRKVFARFDTNSDGKITADELAGVLKALGSATSDDDVAQMMQEIDTDHDGHINLEEFAAFCNGAGDPYRSAEKELHGALEHYEQERDGEIAGPDLHQVPSRLGGGGSEHDCAGMIKSVDSDGDGFVNFHEFRKMMTNNKSKSKTADDVST